MNYDAANEMFQTAVRLVNQSSRNIFLTGKAGTGKTTFLKYIRENCPKQMAVVAPTGVAAINAGGVTIHSFFQLPLSPFIPVSRDHNISDKEFVNRNALLSRLRFNSEKRKLFNQLELLIIDEISMVRCDTLDAIDTVLRFIRKRPNEIFGGVQLLFIGDMFQLPPVIKDQEWKILGQYYESPYFFESVVLKEEPPLYIEFSKIYRQSDERFIQVLNQVRNNELNGGGVKILESRYQPPHGRLNNEGYIILTTHNEAARDVNTRELGKLPGMSFVYDAEIAGSFTESAYPADESMVLKVGAQVMFVRNDTEKSRRFFNGKLGTVTHLAKDSIRVQCKDEDDEIEVNKVEWKNIRYTLNKTNRQMDEEVLGSFSQYPLRLAWAITIHKSQGLTFEKAIIDAGEAFARGQVYVALSRCTSLEGMILHSRIRPDSLYVDPRILKFCTCPDAGLSDEVINAQRTYRQSLLLTIFDFQQAFDSAGDLQVYLIGARPSFNPETFKWLELLIQRLSLVQETARKFQTWLQGQFREPLSMENNEGLRERSVKASKHFLGELAFLLDHIQQSPAITDSRIHASEFNDNLKEVFAELHLKKHLLSGFTGQIDAEDWHKQKREFVLPLFKANTYAGTSHSSSASPHPILRDRLRKMRDAICAPRDIPIYIVAGTRTLDEMAQYLPQSLDELKMISGFGEAKIEKYGQEFLDLIVEYANERGLESLVHTLSPKKARGNTGKRKSKSDTKTESFQLFRAGKSAAQIATERQLSVQTIERHLSFFVSTGDIHIEELVSRDKFLLIEPMIKDYDGKHITPIKEKLGADIEFAEIRHVIAWHQFQTSRDDPQE